MTILLGLVMLYLLTVVLGKLLPGQRFKTYLMVILVAATQVAFALYHMFTMELPLP